MLRWAHWAHKTRVLHHHRPRPGAMTLVNQLRAELFAQFFVLIAFGIGPCAKATDLGEAFGQDVHRPGTHELIAGQVYPFLPSRLVFGSGPEVDLVVLDLDQSLSEIGPPVM